MIGEFANYSGGQAGYNVAGRLQEALQEQIDQSGLPGVRVAKWPQVIADQASALSASQAMSATLVLWGEYDSGRVLAHVQARDPQDKLSGQELRRQVGALSELSLTINTRIAAGIEVDDVLRLGRGLFARRPERPGRERIAQRFGRVPRGQRRPGRYLLRLGSIESEKPRPDLNQVIAYTRSRSSIRPSLLRPSTIVGWRI